MREFLQLAKQFLKTPIEDPAFPMRRDRFGEMLEYLDATMPPIVCLCGSTRFGKEYQKALLDLTIAGNIVLTVGCMTRSDNELQEAGIVSDDMKTAFDELHKRKIDLADSIFVINVGGYIGSSTRNEIEYAESLGKPVSYLEPIPKLLAGRG